MRAFAPLKATERIQAMLRTRTGLTLTALAFASLLAAGCAGNNEAYRQAFAAKSAPAGNGHVVNAPQEQALRAAKLLLARQGFAIDSVDSAAGIIKASRGMQDYSNDALTYDIAATVDVSERSSNSSIVSLAASQKSILHRSWHEWWHLLWIIPLFPIGTQYENTVVAEGDVTDPAFYQAFFTNLDQSLAMTPGGQPDNAVTAAPAAAPPVAIKVAVPVIPVAAPASAPAAAVAPAPASTSPAVSAPASAAVPASVDPVTNRPSTPLMMP